MTFSGNFCEIGRKKQAKFTSAKFCIFSIFTGNFKISNSEKKGWPKKLLPFLAFFRKFLRIWAKKRAKFTSAKFSIFMGGILSKLRKRKSKKKFEFSGNFFKLFYKIRQRRGLTSQVGYVFLLLML